MSDFANPFKNRTVAPSKERAVKVPTYRAENLRRAVADLPCANCQRPGPSQAAHGNCDKGMGLKTADSTLFACCPECHRAIDQGGVYTKEERRALEERLNLRTLRMLVEQGVLHL